MKKQLLTTAILLSAFITMAQEAILINNVKIFNGQDNKTSLRNVLIVNNIITKISSKPIATDKSGNTKIIDGQEKYLIPGLIDNHVHLSLNSASQEVLSNLTTEALDSLTRIEGKKMLLRGFTTVRDLGGPVFTVKKEFDKGTYPGPRIFPSGAMLTQTSGHGDVRMPNEKSKHFGGEVSKAEMLGVSYIADGEPEVLNAVRENLRFGASQIKVHAGGGASTLNDPLDVTQYTLDELKAAVMAAEDWGTYVTAHAYTSKSAMRAIEAGVKVIEHGQLLDEATIKVMAKKGIFLSLQAFDPAPEKAPASVKIKKQQVINGTDYVFNKAKKNKIKILWGTDYLFDPASGPNQNSDILKLEEWFSEFEILRLITYGNAQVFALSGLRNPYLEGKLGEITEGAYADMILVDANPLKDISIMKDYEKNFLLIIKNGVIYKNTLEKTE